MWSWNSWRIFFHINTIICFGLNVCLFIYFWLAYAGVSHVHVEPVVSVLSSCSSSHLCSPVASPSCWLRFILTFSSFLLISSIVYLLSCASVTIL